MSVYEIFMSLFLLFYFGVIIGVRTWMLFNETKINAVKGFGTKKKIRIAERLIQLGLMLLLIIGLNFIFIKSSYRFFRPIAFLEIGWLRYSGFILGMVGLLLTFLAQLQMKNSWRLGLDDTVSINLVQDGFFRYSRNPIYLGLGIGFFGFFLIAPNIGSLVFLILMTIAVNLKIKDEEQFLMHHIPEKYETYKKKVRRWI